jgi:hypothetical protein
VPCPGNPAEQRTLAAANAGIVDHRILDKPPTKFVAFVQATHFQGMDEGARQVEVWRLLRDELTPEQPAQVEFVFTDTPQERRQIDAGTGT